MTQRGNSANRSSGLSGLIYWWQDICGHGTVDPCRITPQGVLPWRIRIVSSSPKHNAPNCAV
jgi:hypothetical protein